MHIPDGYLGPQTYAVLDAAIIPIWMVAGARIRKALKARQVPLMALGDLIAAVSVGGSNRRHVSVPELKRLLPFMVLGIVLGVTVLVNVPQAPLKVGLALFAMAVGLYSILNPAPKGTISPWWCCLLYTSPSPRD